MAPSYIHIPSVKTLIESMDTESIPDSSIVFGRRNSSFQHTILSDVNAVLHLRNSQYREADLLRASIKLVVHGNAYTYFLDPVVHNGSDVQA